MEQQIATFGSVGCIDTLEELGQQRLRVLRHTPDICIQHYVDNLVDKWVAGVTVNRGVHCHPCHLAMRPVLRERLHDDVQRVPAAVSSGSCDVDDPLTAIGVIAIHTPEQINHIVGVRAVEPDECVPGRPEPGP